MATTSVKRQSQWNCSSFSLDIARFTGNPASTSPLPTAKATLLTSKRRQPSSSSLLQPTLPLVPEPLSAASTSPCPSPCASCAYQPLPSPLSPSSPSFLRAPAGLKLPQQVQDLPASSCVVVAMATSPGLPGVSSLQDLLLPSPVSTTCRQRFDPDDFEFAALQTALADPHRAKWLHYDTTAFDGHNNTHATIEKLNNLTTGIELPQTRLGVHKNPTPLRAHTNTHL